MQKRVKLKHCNEHAAKTPPDLIRMSSYVINQNNDHASKSNGKLIILNK